MPQVERYLKLMKMLIYVAFIDTFVTPHSDAFMLIIYFPALIFFHEVFLHASTS